MRIIEKRPSLLHHKSRFGKTSGLPTPVCCVEKDQFLPNLLTGSASSFHRYKLGLAGPSASKVDGGFLLEKLPDTYQLQRARIRGVSRPKDPPKNCNGWSKSHPLLFERVRCAGLWPVRHSANPTMPVRSGGLWCEKGSEHQDPISSGTTYDNLWAPTNLFS